MFEETRVVVVKRKLGTVGEEIHLNGCEGGHLGGTHDDDSGGTLGVVAGCGC